MRWTLAAGLALLAAVGPTPAQPKKEKPRLVVDASRDGGLWWHPQVPKAQDPARPHQGKLLADGLRRQGWEVIEIPHGGPVKLDGATAVLRTDGSYGTAYTPAEIGAYKEFVKGGGTLVLVGHASRFRKLPVDTLAAEFGYDFGEELRAPALTWSEDPLVKGLTPAPLGVGSKLTKTPSGARTLGTVGSDTVAAAADFEKGRVIAIGTATWFIQGHPVAGRLFPVPKK